MTLNADLTTPAVVHTETLPWDPSPAPGVDRRRIERNGDEVARLTSLVRYAPGCAFPPHTHGGGEEYLVLSGTFCDETRAHPAGTYVRNGVGSTHAPFTDTGCVIFVRLWWMHPDETASTALDTTAASWQATPHGHQLTLHRSAYEEVELVRLDEPVDLDATGGLEVFLLRGATAKHPAGTWLRLPEGTLRLDPIGQTELLVRRGHLRQPPPLPRT